MGAIQAGIAGGLQAVGITEAREARKDQAKARKIQQRSNRLQAGRSAMEQVRAGQVARAQVIQAGENQGVSGSSAVQGGASSVQAQVGGTLDFASQLFAMQQSANRLQESAFKHQSNAQDAKAITDLALQAGGV